jgi:hypothetical protein
MGMIYSVVFSSVAVTAQQDFFEYTAPSDAVAVIHSVELTQSTDVGDAASEGLAILHKRGATVSGSGGSTPTPAPLELGFTAAGGVAKVNNTTKANTGTIVTMHSSNWIIQSPYLWLPTPEYRHVLSPSQRYTVELGTTPADSITVSGTLIVEEIGG